LPVRMIFLIKIPRFVTGKRWDLKSNY